MQGRTLTLTLPRRIVNDMLHEAAKVPTVPVQRTIDVSTVARQREFLPRGRLSWTTIFTWAMAQVAAEIPALRRVYLAYPWARLYEYPASTAMVALEREYEGEPIVVFFKIKKPEALTLHDLEATIQRFKTIPLTEVTEFQRSLNLARLPTPLRRLSYRIGLNWGRQRANYFGTFGVTSYAALGAESLHPISPCTITLTYGIINERGEVPVRMIYDHRVTDGATIARALVCFERILQSRVLFNLIHSAPRISG